MKREVVDRLSLSDRQAEMIDKLLRDYIPDRPVWAFGSRAFGQARRYSDLDLAIGGPGPLSVALEYELEDAFDRSMLPIEVDLVDLNDVSDAFRARIEPYFVPVQEPHIDRA